METWESKIFDTPAQVKWIFKRKQQQQQQQHLTVWTIAGVSRIKGWIHP